MSKIQFKQLKAIPTNSILGRGSVGSGNIEELTLGAGFTTTGGTLEFTNDGNGIFDGSGAIPNSSATNITIGGSSTLGLKADSSSQQARLNFLQSNNFTRASIGLTLSNDISVETLNAYFNANILGYHVTTQSNTFGVSGFRLTNSSSTRLIDLRSDGTLGIGVTPVTSTSRVQIQGQGSTSGTTALLVQNSLGTDLFEVKDDGTILGNLPNIYAADGTIGSSRVATLTNSLTFDASGVGGDSLIFQGGSNNNKGLYLFGSTGTGGANYKAALVNIGGGTSAQLVLRTASGDSVVNTGGISYFNGGVNSLGVLNSTPSTAAYNFNVKQPNGGNGLRVYTANGQNEFHLHDNGGGTAVVRFLSSGICYFNTAGNFGIGTAIPSAKLHVNGDIRIDDGTAQAGYILTASDSGGTATWQVAPSGATDTNFYTTGTTLVGTTAYFDRSDSLSAYTLDLSGAIPTELNDLTDVTTTLPPVIDEADDGKMLYLDSALSAFTTDDNVTHGTVVINAKKASAGTIAKGTPVYLVGFDTDLHTVEEANASTATTMPVIGFAAEELDDTNSKHIMTFGKLSGVVTSGYTVGDDLYISTTTGQLTTIRPTGDVEIQRVATVLKVDAVNGQILIYNTARTAGLPNLAEKHIWIGDSNGQPVEEITRDLYISDMTNVNLLDDNDNWDNDGNFIGSAMTETYQGQKHYNDNYYFECIHDNVWIRLYRTVFDIIYIEDQTTIDLLDDLANWDVNGDYVGTAITGTIQGNKHYNGSYFFECVHDNVWIRTIRG